MKTDKAKIWQSFETEVNAKCAELSKKHSKAEFKHAFDVLEHDVDDVLKSEWSQATKDVWTTMDELYKKYEPQIDDDAEDFCGVLIMFDYMMPNLI